MKNTIALVTGVSSGIGQQPPPRELPAMQTLLAESRWGRTILHVTCAARDHHLHWHWRGIVREVCPVGMP